jgi:hypothetical protein
MKKILKTFVTYSGLALLMLSSCKKNDALVTANTDKAGALTASTTTPVIDRAKIADSTNIVSFGFTASQYGVNIAETNTLQIDSVGDNWVNPVSYTLPAKALTQGFNTAQLDAMLLKIVPADIASKVNVRVQHALSGTTNTYSNVLSLTVTPINLTSWLYVVGAFNGWSATTPDSLISATGNNVYTGIINFPAGAGNNQFLILPAKTFDNKYATSDPVSQVPSTTAAYNAGNNFNAPATAGQYIVTLDVNKGTITFAAADYYSILGSAPPGVAWSTDTFMKYVNDGTGTWVLNGVPMIVGEYKFRQDAQWTFGWGPSATDGVVTDVAPLGDGNIQLTTAGTYNFTFVMPATSYGTVPLVTTTYTITKQ